MKLKKMLSMLLVVVCVLSLSTVAFADETITTENGSSTAQPVTATLAAGSGASDTGVVYSVVVSWLITSGSYTDGGTRYKWDPDNHKYIVDDTYVATSNITGTDPSISVTVTNHSNADVTASVAYADTNASIASSVASWSDNGSKVLDSAAKNVTSYTDTTNGAATNVTFAGTVTITTGKGNITSNTILGTVTLTLSNCSTSPVDKITRS